MSVAAPLRLDRPIDPAELGELMRSFNAATEQLVSTHAALQSRVEELQRELAEANARLRRTEALAALGEMAAGIAHEIRNPLGSIRLYAQVLGDEVGDRPSARGLCERIDAATVRLDEVVREVLAFARHTRLNPQPIDPEELADRAVSACEAILAEHGVAVARGGDDPGLPPLVVDAGLLSSALANIVRNAVEALADAEVEAPRIAIRVCRRRRRRPDGTAVPCAVFTIEDNGPGIDPELLPRLFNPFFTTRASGTGLGLSIVHRVVDAHGGNIDVGRSDGGGARFDVYIPEDGPTADEAAGDGTESRGGIVRRTALEAC